MHMLARVFGRAHQTLQPSPERAVTRNIARLIVLCASAEEVIALQVREATPTLYRAGVSWAQDSRYRLRDGRQVEFLSARGTLWWSRLQQRSDLPTVVVPLYRRDQTLDPDLRRHIDARLQMLSRSIMVLDVAPEEL